MSNRIDKLFKNSLSEHKVSPSAEAWQKVQSGLSKKNNTLIAWRMAAVLVLFGALMSLLYFLNHDERIVPSQLTQTIELVVPEKEKDIDLKSMESNPERRKPTVAQTNKSNEVIRKNVNEQIDDKEDVKNSSSENLALNDNESKKDVLEAPIVNEPVLMAQTTKPEKPIVIEFTLESLSETPIAEVALSDGDDSGLKKILYAARDMKNGESDLGIIRDTKNQLFALDFKKDKTKRN